MNRKNLIIVIVSIILAIFSYLIFGKKLSKNVENNEVESDPVEKNTFKITVPKENSELEHHMRSSIKSFRRSMVSKKPLPEDVCCESDCCEEGMIPRKS